MSGSSGWIMYFRQTIVAFPGHVLPKDIRYQYSMLPSTRWWLKPREVASSWPSKYTYILYLGLHARSQIVLFIFCFCWIQSYVNFRSLEYMESFVIIIIIDEALVILLLFIDVQILLSLVDDCMISCHQFHKVLKLSSFNLEQVSKKLRSLLLEKETRNLLNCQRLMCKDMML